MYERLLLIRELMAEPSCIYLHCDQKKVHQLRCLLDEIFGPEAFMNELIWQKTRVSKGQSLSYGNIHDTILVYRKGSELVFHAQYEPYTDDYVKSHYNLVDEHGRAYGLWDFTQAGQGGPRWFGDKSITPPPGKHWIWSQTGIDDGMAQGLIEFTSTGTPRLRRYLDKAKGRRVGDIWTDVYDINSQALERLAYPTQKPETLLERIIRASSNPGDIVFDCFMGSGTTQAIAMKLGRRFIGADINPGAVQITTRRLIQVGKELAGKDAGEKKQPGLGLVVDEVDGVDGETVATAEEPTVFYTGFEVYNVNHYDIFRNPVEARELLMQALEVVPLPAGSIYDGTKDGRMVKIMPVNRIATRGDLNDLIANFDYKAFERRYAEHPTSPVEKITLVCMGHEPDLAAVLKKEIAPKVLDVEVYDVLRDGQHLEFKRDAEAQVKVKDGWLVIEAFYPMNLLGKLSLQKETVEDWRELAESVMVDWNYDGAVLTPAVVDIPEKNGLVVGRYRAPEEAGTIRVKITDLLSESWEGEAR